MMPLSRFKSSILDMKIRNVTTIQMHSLSGSIYNQFFKCLHFPKYKASNAVNELIKLGTCVTYMKIMSLRLTKRHAVKKYKRVAV
jgi:hypothetical protein